MHGTSERDEIQNRYSSLVELSPDAVFVECDGKFVYLNAAAMGLFGATRVEQMLGRSPMEFVATESQDAAGACVANLKKVGDSVALDNPCVDVCNRRRLGASATFRFS